MNIINANVPAIAINALQRARNAAELVDIARRCKEAFVLLECYDHSETLRLIEQEAAALSPDTEIDHQTNGANAPTSAIGHDLAVVPGDDATVVAGSTCMTETGPEKALLSDEQCEEFERLVNSSIHELVILNQFAQDNQAEEAANVMTTLSLNLQQMHTLITEAQP